MERTVVHSWITDVYLQEIPDIPFNSVMFRDAEKVEQVREKESNGFSIMCLRCGKEMTIKPGIRSFENEPIKFGIDRITEENWISCTCGHKFEVIERFEPEDGDIGERKWVEYWVDVSRRPPIESTVYGNDCPGGRCKY